MKAKSRDCSSCKKKPEAGSHYEETPCAKCFPLEPSNNRNGIMEQKPAWWWKKYDQRKTEGLDKIIRF